MRHGLLIAAAVLSTVGFGAVFVPLGLIVAAGWCGAAWWLLEDVTDGETD